MKVVDQKGSLYGTAFFMDKEYCVTCHHCIYKLEKIFVGKQRKIYPATWVEEYSDVSKDFAYLKVAGLKSAPLSYRLETVPSIPVYVLGFPEGKIENLPMGDVVPGNLSSAYIPIHWDKGEEEGKNKWNRKPSVNVSVYSIERKFDFGFSGAPVCHKDDLRVMGMFVALARDEDKGYVLPIETILLKFISEKSKNIHVLKPAIKTSASAAPPPAPPLNLQVDYADMMTPVKNQGQEGSVIGHAITGALEFQVKKWINKNIILSSRYVYDNAKKYDGSPPERDAGATVRSAIKVLKNNGVPPERYWAYVAGHRGRPLAEADKEAKFYRIREAIPIKNDEVSWKTYLRLYGPFITGIAWFSDNNTLEVNTTGKLKTPTKVSRMVGGHAVVVVGFNENVFKFKNSWGEDWGDKGYGYFCYDYIKSYTSDSWGIIWIPPSIVGRSYASRL